MFKITLIIVITIVLGALMLQQVNVINAKPNGQKPPTSGVTPTPKPNKPTTKPHNNLSGLSYDSYSFDLTR